jgi:pyruvate/2-oxoglutarate dehydrogenase complex dihydrolipoamide dehydrogenase (E3) component
VAAIPNSSKNRRTREGWCPSHVYGYTDSKRDESHRIDPDGIFVQIGLVPDTEWLKGPLTLSSRGEIEIDAHNATNIPGAFTAGDVTTVPYKQIIVAMGEGTKAGLSAFDHIIRHFWKDKTGKIKRCTRTRPAFCQKRFSQRKASFVENYWSIGISSANSKFKVSLFLNP